MKKMKRKMMYVGITLSMLILPANLVASDVPAVFYDGDESNRVFTTANNVEALSHLQEQYEVALSSQFDGAAMWLDEASRTANTLDKIAVIVAEDGEASATQRTIIEGYLVAIDNQNRVLKQRLFEHSLHATAEVNYHRVLHLGEALNHSQKLEVAIEKYRQTMKDGDYESLDSLYLTEHVFNMTRTLASLS